MRDAGAVVAGPGNASQPVSLTRTENSTDCDVPKLLVRKNT